MKFKGIVFAFVIAFLLSCTGENVAPSASGNSGGSNSSDVVSIVARNYLNEVIGIMQSNSINRDDIDWTNLKAEAFAQLSNNAQTIADTYPGILKALELLEDNHSFYRTSTGSYLNPNSVICEGSEFSAPDLPSHIGYVEVTNFSGSVAGTDGITFAENIQDQIREADYSDIIGWIVDLRANTGGNMWPMIAGVGPILGEGVSGYFVYADELEQPWGFQNGGSQLDGNIVTPLTNSYSLINPNPKVAVLLDNGVASSGEAVAVSFIGRPNTRTFGTSTCGLSTANQPFVLSDNAMLLLTTSYFADRNLNVYGAEIEPEQASSSGNTLNDAINWIEN